MSYYRKRFDVGTLIAIAIAAFFLFAGIGACQNARYSRSCLEKGYPAARVTWGGLGQPFCIKRVDQTDEVVPLESL